MTCSTAVWQSSTIAITVGDDNSRCFCVAEETASSAFQKLCERADVKSGVRDGRKREVRDRRVKCEVRMFRVEKRVT